MKNQLPERKSLRLKNYDYSRSAIYYITICTMEKKHLFGAVANEQMKLNNLGKVVEDLWLAIPEHYPEVKIHDFVIMSNHLHGLIEICDIGEKTPILGNIVKGFKIGVSKWCKQHTDIEGVWQRGFYDHIIRDENELWHAMKYIRENPENWKKDKYY